MKAAEAPLFAPYRQVVFTGAGEVGLKVCVWDVRVAENVALRPFKRRRASTVNAERRPDARRNVSDIDCRSPYGAGR